VWDQFLLCLPGVQSLRALLPTITSPFPHLSGLEFNEALATAAENPGDDCAIVGVLMALMLVACDSCDAGITGPHPLKSTPPLSCGVEVASLDCWSKALGLPVYKVLGLSGHGHWSSFYTAALNPDLTEVVNSAQFGARFTPHLKIKVNDDVELCSNMLAVLKSTFVEGVAACCVYPPACVF
jgi:hypothetical protein